jgi:hypothetical protein
MQDIRAACKTRKTNSNEENHISRESHNEIVKHALRNAPTMTIIGAINNVKRKTP